MDFYQLDKPSEAVWQGKWIVFVSDDMFLILSTNHELVYGPERLRKEYLFDTEWEAYMASVAYYNHHEMVYPYIEEMKVSLKASPFNLDDGEYNESRIMEFI